MDDSLEKLNGKPVRILFRNSSNFYTVMLFRTSDEEDRTLTVTGICPSIQTDVMYNIYGRYVEHPRYGIQFALEHYEVSLPSEEEGVIRFLSGPSFPGIGHERRTPRLPLGFLRSESDSDASSHRSPPRKAGWKTARPHRDEYS